MQPECYFCGARLRSWDDCAEAGWTPCFYYGWHLRECPVCPDCTRKHLHQGDDGEIEFNPLFAEKEEF